MVAEPYAVLEDRERLGAFGHVRGLSPAMAGFATVIGVAWANGGYFPTSWGWASLAFLVAAVAVLAAPGRIAVARPERVFLGAVAGLVGWTALSVVWSASVPSTVAEVERTLVYLAAALALVLAVRRDAVARVLGGVLAGITAVALYGLATRLFPEQLGSFDPVAGYRLAEPLGYWNALGLLCAMGSLLAVGLAARRAPREGRALAGAALPVLVATLHFTFSRGAWVALAAGLAAMLLLGRDRLRLVATAAALAPASVVAVALASRAHALTHAQSSLAAAAGEGQRIAPVLALVTLLAAISMLGLAELQRRVDAGPAAHRAIGVALVAGALVAAGVGVLLAGGPGRVAHDAYAGFTAPPAKGPDLNRRVLSLSSDGRTALWTAAWQDAQAHPLLGSGAGTYEGYFDEHRNTSALTVRDAHSLYLETLAELGPVGLALVLLALGLPLVAAVRARRDGLVVAAAGAYAAFLVHAAWDWDWEVPAVTLTALALGVALLARARRQESAATLSPRMRMGLASALIVPIAFACVVVLGNRATASAQSAAAAGQWPRAAAEARTAHRLAPWAADPLRSLAQARMAGGDFTGAAATLRSAIRLDPRNWALWFDLSVATSGAERQQALDRARQLNPLDPVFWS